MTPKGHRAYRGYYVPDNWKEWQCALMCFGQTQGDEKLSFWKAFVESCWPEPVFVWDEWCDLFFGALCGAKETVERITGKEIGDAENWWRNVIFTGAASCVAGHTKILNPQTGKETTIEDLFKAGKPSCVMTLGGPAMAETPFIKGTAELFEVTLDDGSKFTATGGHRVLSPDGYVHVSDLQHGEELVGYALFHPLTNSDICHEAHHGDADRYPDTIRDFQSDYQTLFYSCGERLRYGKETSQFSFPSPTDAPQRMLHDGNLDVRDNKFEYTRPCQASCHPSNYNVSLSSDKKGTPFLHQSNLEKNAPCPSLFRSFFQSQKANNLPLPFLKPSEDYDSRNQPCDYDEQTQESYNLSSVNYTVQLKQVQEIKYVGTDIYYDMTVPKQHHYFAEGAIHHNTGKSAKEALWIIGNWLAAQEHTSCILTSTSREMLGKRIWSDILTWIGSSVIKFPLRVIASDLEIRWNDDDRKSTISGIAVKSGGDAMEAVDRIKGIHNRRVFVVIDEMTSVPAAIVTACRNLNKGTQEFQLIGSGNARRHDDPHGERSEPANGWGSITVDDTFWLTPYGCAVHFDATKAPSMKDPSRYYFYPNKQQLEEDAKEKGGVNSPEYWSGVRGFWPPSGLSTTVMDEAMLDQFNTRDAAVWKNNDWRMCASLDPSFEGGDRRVLYPFKFGTFSNGVKGLEFLDPIIVGIDSTTDVRWIHYAISDAVQRQCEALGVKPEDFIMDTTGEGGGLFSVLSGRWSAKIKSCEFGGAAEKTQVDRSRPVTYYEMYANKVAAMWFRFRRFVEGGQIKGLRDPETRKELTSRDRTMKGARIGVVSKKEMKGIGHNSPDKGDSACIAAQFMFDDGVMPSGPSGGGQPFDAEQWDKMANAINLYEDENAYSEECYV